MAGADELGGVYRVVHELRVGEVGGVEMLSKSGKTTTTVPAGVGADGWDLVQWMMRPDWKERPSVDEALKHPFWEAPMFF